MPYRSNMKVTAEQYKKMSEMIAFIGKERIESYRTFLQSPENPRKPKDFKQRLRWDLLAWACGSEWICGLYKTGCNDDHIDNALKSVMVDIGVEIN